MAEKKVVKRTGLKNVRKAKKRHARNLLEKTNIKKVLKDARKAIAAKTAEAQALVKKALAVFDKAAQRGIIHGNKAARLKSRLMLALNKLK